MLVVHPDSLCDICLDGFSDGMSAPHAIACGHIFCFACLQCLARPYCPLCRKPFDMSEVRKLHTDKVAPSPRGPFSSVVDDNDTSEANQYRISIARIIEQGCPSRMLLEKLEEISAWLRMQPREQHFDIRMTHRLLRQRYKDAQYYAEQKRQLQEAADKLQAQMVLERDEAQDRYDALVQTCKNERDRSQAMQESLKEHHQKVEAELKQKCASLLDECERLRDELARVHPNRLPTPPRESDWFTSSGVSSEGPASEPTEPIIRRSALSIALANSNGEDFLPIPSTPALPDDIPDFTPIPTDDEGGVSHAWSVISISPHSRRRAHETPSVTTGAQTPQFEQEGLRTPRSLPRHHMLESHSPSRARPAPQRTPSYDLMAAARSSAPDAGSTEIDPDELRRQKLNEILELTPATQAQDIVRRSPTRRIDGRRSRSPEEVPVASQSYSSPSRMRPRTATTTSLPAGYLQHQHSQSNLHRPSIVSASSAALEAERQRTPSFGTPGLGRPGYLRRGSSASAKGKYLEKGDRFPNGLGISF